MLLFQFVQHDIDERHTHEAQQVPHHVGHALEIEVNEQYGRRILHRNKYYDS